MCFICGLIMLFICWHQKRQLKKQEHFNEAEAALKPSEVDEAVIPSGQTLKELMDMSTGKNSQCKTAGFESSKLFHWHPANKLWLIHIYSNFLPQPMSFVLLQCTVLFICDTEQYHLESYTYRPKVSLR